MCKNRSRRREPRSRSWIRRRLAEMASAWTAFRVELAAEWGAFRGEIEAELEKARQDEAEREERVNQLLIAQIRELGEWNKRQDRQLEALRRSDDELWATLESEQAPW